MPQCGFLLPNRSIKNRGRIHVGKRIPFEIILFLEQAFHKLPMEVARASGDGFHHRVTSGGKCLLIQGDALVYEKRGFLMD